MKQTTRGGAGRAETGRILLCRLSQGPFLIVLGSKRVNNGTLPEEGDIICPVAPSNRSGARRVHRLIRIEDEPFQLKVESGAAPSPTHESSRCQRLHPRSRLPSSRVTPAAEGRAFP